MTEAIGLSPGRLGRTDLAKREHVVETVAYVVAVDDEGHDLLHPIGLVDDEERFTALLRRPGRRPLRPGVQRSGR